MDRAIELVKQEISQLELAMEDEQGEEAYYNLELQLQEAKEILSLLETEVYRVGIIH